MAWKLTSSRDNFVAAAGELLRADPVASTVLLSVLETLRHGGISVYGDEDPLFGWHESAAGRVDGAFLQTPPFPALIASLPGGSAVALIELLTCGGRQLTSANLTGSDQAGFVAAWSAVTGGQASERMRTRLFRLGTLVPPDPFPPGTSRLATAGDRDLAIGWHAAFGVETGTGAENPGRVVDDKLSYGGVLLWEADAQAVAMAALTRTIAGVARVATVYTPPEHRRRGFGGAVTTAASRAALAAGAAEVVLFTDQANPTSNALYHRLGYRQIGDRVLLDLAPAVTGRELTSS